MFSRDPMRQESIGLKELVGGRRFYSERAGRPMLVVMVCSEEISDVVNLHKCVCLKTS